MFNTNRKYHFDNTRYKNVLKIYKNNLIKVFKMMPQYYTNLMYSRLRELEMFYMFTLHYFKPIKYVKRTIKYINLYYKHIIRN